jgi:V/A-type H+-transporting ATPase subunit E
MNGIENITQRIGEETRREIDEIRKNAEAECESIKNRYKALAQDEYWKTVAKGKEESDRRTERMKSLAQTEVKKQMLALKQEMIAAAFDMAVLKVLSLEESKYIDFLVNLAVNASRNGKEQIILSPGDRTRFGKKVVVSTNEALASKGRPAALTLSEQSRAIKGGLILQDGNIEINCSIETITALRKNELAGEVAKLLFE